MASFPGGSSISLIFCSFRLSSLCFCHLSEVGRPVPRGFRPPDEELALQQPRCAIRGLILMAYSMGIPNEKRPDLIFDTEVDHVPGRFMPLVTNTPLGTLAHFVLGLLQSLPSTRILLASGLLFSKLSKLLGALMFEGTDPTSGYNERLGGRGSNGRQVDFAKIDGGLNVPWGRVRLWDFDADMQLKATIPDQCSSPAVGRQLNGKDQRWATFAHRKHNPSFFLAHRLSGPVDGIEVFGTPGILHAHLWMRFAKFTSRGNGGEKSVNDHLHGLAMQSKVAFGGLLQLIAPRPLALQVAGRFVCFHANIPHLRGFHLCLFEVTEEPWSKVIELIDANGPHRLLFFFFARKMAIREKQGRFHPAPCNGAGLPAPILRMKALPNLGAPLFLM